MANVNIRNLNSINAQQPLHGQAFNDVAAHLSTHQTLIESLQKQIAALQQSQKVGK